MVGVFKIVRLEELSHSAGTQTLRKGALPSWYWDLLWGMERLVLGELKTKMLGTGANCH